MEFIEINKKTYPCFTIEEKIYPSNTEKNKIFLIFHLSESEYIIIESVHSNQIEQIGKLKDYYIKAAKNCDYPCYLIHTNNHTELDIQSVGGIGAASKLFSQKIK